MTDFTHHTTKPEADLAGVPRPVSSEDALRQAESHAAVAETILEASPRIVPSLRAKLHTDTAIMLHALVSERDALAGRVAELEGHARRVMQHVEGDLPSKGWLRDNRESRQALHGFRAALSATTPESKP